MNLHEYQAKELFQRGGIAVVPGIVCVTPAEVRAAAEKIGGPVMVKAQVHSGGRGKAGGVKFCPDPASAEEKSRAILALGADFVLIGRPFLYALGADGYAGLQAMIELLRNQIDIGLAQLGCPDINDLDDGYIVGNPMQEVQ